MTASATLISPVEAARLSGAAEVVLLDVRTPLEYGEVHVGGSRLAPLGEWEAGKLAGEVAGRRVLVMCRSGKRAAQAAAQLAAAGVGEVAVVDGGMMAWQAAGLPVVEGGKVMSLERQVRVAAGLLVVTGVVLGTWVHPALYGLSALVGAGLIFAGVTDWCGMGLLLAKAPWNKVAGTTSTAAAGPPPSRSTCCGG